jgi:hypothetical protein
MIEKLWREFVSVEWVIQTLTVSVLIGYMDVVGAVMTKALKDVKCFSCKYSKHIDFQYGYCRKLRGITTIISFRDCEDYRERRGL